MMMSLEDVYWNLCTRDKRYPAWGDLYEDGVVRWDDEPPPRAGCACDNCFYGRDKLAVYILVLRGE